MKFIPFTALSPLGAAPIAVTSPLPRCFPLSCLGLAASALRYLTAAYPLSAGSFPTAALPLPCRCPAATLPCRCLSTARPRRSHCSPVLLLASAASGLRADRLTLLSAGEGDKGFTVVQRIRTLKLTE